MHAPGSLALTCSGHPNLATPLLLPSGGPPGLLPGWLVGLLVGQSGALEGTREGPLLTRGSLAACPLASRQVLPMVSSAKDQRESEVTYAFLGSLPSRSPWAD